MRNRELLEQKKGPEPSLRASGTRQWVPYVAEVAGTFALVFAGCGAIVIDRLSGGQVTRVGLVFGPIMTVMIYSLGHLSGAHFNPAVTLGLVLAAGCLRLLFGDVMHLGATLPAGSGGAWQPSVWRRCSPSC